MKKVKLLALVSILGLGAITGINTVNSGSAYDVSLTDVNSKKLAATETNSVFSVIDGNIRKETDGQYHTYILLNEIRSNAGDPVFGSASFNINLSNIGLDQTELITTTNKSFSTEIKYDALTKNHTVTVTGLKGNTNGELLTISSEKVSAEPLNIYVHVLNSYYNLPDKTIPKPLKKQDKFNDITIRIADDSDISGILENEIEAEIISGENCLRWANAIENPFEYKFMTKAPGEAKVRIRYVKKFDGFKGVVRETIYTIKIIENDKYCDFYQFNLENELVKLNSKDPIQTETSVQQTLYLGNGTADFDPTEFVIHKDTNEAAFKSIGIFPVVRLGNPYLEIKLITGDVAQTANLSIGYRDSDATRSIKFNIQPSPYKIFIDNSKIRQEGYYVAENINFAEIQGLINVTKDGQLFNTPFEILPAERRLGKQRIFVNFPIIDKKDSFVINITLDHSVAPETKKLDSSGEVFFYKELLSRIEFRLPSEYEDADEGYEYLKDQYKLLSSKAKEILLGDVNFNKIYRRYIIENGFKTSFFEGIRVRLDNRRYIFPTITLAGLLAAFGIILGCSLHTIYRKKEKKPKKEKPVKEANK